ncbi:SulP family inorganic anion transporter [Virgibacillus soli]|uniref:SulP family inorganic anion transporter n=1 Tax=Paracerasibacillus soli TaxID=480284 RepID=UPI0035EAD801
MLEIKPRIKRLGSYNLEHLPSDLTAGIIVTFLLLPQSMAYASLAGVPITMGLFAGTFPLIVYAIFGSSKYLSVGPVSVVSLLTFTGIASITNPDSNNFLELVVFLALLVGILQLIMGLLKIGLLLEYVTPAVIGGFTSALAFIIIFHQLHTITGVTAPTTQNFILYAFEVIRTLPTANPVSMVIGLSSFLVLLIMKSIARASPGPIIVILASILCVDYFNLHLYGVTIVGEIPQQFQHISFQLPGWETIISLLPIALIISFIAFFESFSVAKTLANKEKESLNANQELMSLGFTNITSSLIGTFPVAGAISRTAVNYEAGAKTRLSTLITALLMLLAIFYVTPLFYFLPKAALGAIIIYAVRNLIHIKQWNYYRKHNRPQAFVFLVTFIATLCIDVFLGLMFGVILSIFIHLWNQKLPVTSLYYNKS